MIDPISEIKLPVCQPEQPKKSDEIAEISLKSLSFNNLELISGCMWKCIAITPIKDGGSILTFIFKQSVCKDLGSHHDYVWEILTEIYPAVECFPISHPDNLNPLKSVFSILLHDDLTNNKEFIELLTLLGFSYAYVGNSYQLSIPDHEALEKGWEKYRKDHDYLCPLRLAKVEGVASDEEFIETIFKFNAILSTGEEFIHDTSTHIIAALAFLLEAKSNYPEIKKKFIDTINLFYEPIKWAKENKMDLPYEQLTALVGIMVDTLTTVPPKVLIKDLNDMLVEQFIRLNNPLESSNWIRYFKKRFQIDTETEIIRTWDRMLSTYYATKAGFSKEAIEQIMKIEKPISTAVFFLSQIKSCTPEDLEVLETSIDPYNELVFNRL